MKVFKFTRGNYPLWWINFLNSYGIYSISTKFSDYNAKANYNYARGEFTVEFKDDDLYIEFILTWS